jgi:hypothetical protein
MSSSPCTGPARRNTRARSISRAISSALRHAKDRGLVVSTTGFHRHGAIWLLTSRGRMRVNEMRLRRTEPFIPFPWPELLPIADQKARSAGALCARAD